MTWLWLVPLVLAFVSAVLSGWLWVRVLDQAIADHHWDREDDL